MAIKSLCGGAVFKMNLLQRIIEHFQNLVLVSDITMMLMEVSIILMSVVYCYCIIVKNSKYESIVAKVGILVRILMIIGFTIEFSHQKVIYQDAPMVDGKLGAVEQFSNYLFYGYIFVIGIYDILTIGINKFRGFFHTFDLAMMSMPILYGLTISILNFSFNNDTLIGFLILASLIMLPFMFFKLYWKQSIFWYSLFLGYTLVMLIIYLSLKMKIIVSSTLVSYLLIGMYELCRHLFRKVKENFVYSTWNILKSMSIVMPVILIYSSIIAMNVLPLQINKKYNVDSYYREDASFTSLNEAEKLARTSVGDSTSNVRLWEGTSENFNNRYMFSVGNYSVSIDGATGKVFDIKIQNEIKVNPQNKVRAQDIKIKTVKWLKSIGFNYDESRHYIKIEESSNKFIVSIFNMYNDGSIDDRPAAGIEWYSDGKLCSANLGLIISNIKDYPEIKTNELEIASSIKAWYDKLGEGVPPYLFETFLYWFGEPSPSIHVKCKNNDSFRLDPFNGKIKSFSRDIKQNEKNKQGFTQETYNKYKGRAEQLAKNFGRSLGKFNYSLMESSKYEQGYYSFVYKNNILTKYIDVGLDSQGNLNSFREESNIEAKLYSDKEFKISSSTALKLVANQYKPFGIYTRRVKLAAEIMENGDINYKWMVMVIPFKDVEHQIYYVDVNTGKVTPLLNYKR